MTAPGRPLVVAGAALVVHLVVSLAHGVPHAAIPVPLSVAQQAFVWLVIVLGPVVGFALAWRGRVRTGAAVYTLTTLGAFAFGVSHHFLLANPDNVAAVPPGPWRVPFVWTAVLVAISDAAGVLAGSWLWTTGEGNSRERTEGDRSEPAPIDRVE